MINVSANFAKMCGKDFAKILISVYEAVTAVRPSIVIFEGEVVDIQY